MKNRAKCKLCNSIIESFHEKDYVTCKCGEISVDGGDAMRCAAKNFDNFKRIDDEGNEIDVQTKEVYTKEYMLKMLSDFIDKLEDMPPQAKYTSVNHYDLMTSLTLIYAILQSKD